MKYKDKPWENIQMVIWIWYEWKTSKGCKTCEAFSIIYQIKRSKREVHANALSFYDLMTW